MGLKLMSDLLMDEAGLGVLLDRLEISHVKWVLVEGEGDGEALPHPELRELAGLIGPTLSTLSPVEGSKQRRNYY